jgi:hypothetical protein
MKKYTALFLIISLTSSILAMAASAGENDSGLTIDVGENKSLYEAVTSQYGSITYEALYGYGNKFKCLLEYTDNVSILMTPIDTLIYAPKLRESVRAEAVNMLNEVTVKRDVCEADFDELKNDPKSLIQLNQLAHDQYSRLARFISGDKIKATSEDKSNPIAPCVADLLFIEYMNLIVNKCVKY